MWELWGDRQPASPSSGPGFLVAPRPRPVMTPTALVAVLLLFALLALSAFFSSAETAIFTLPTDVPAGEVGDGAQQTLNRLRADPHRLLVTILVGNNVVNVAISSLTTVLLVSVLPSNLAVAAATIVVSTVLLVFGEIVPKSYGHGHARRWSLTVARPLAVVGWLLTPLVLVFDGVTRWLTIAVGGDMDVEELYLEE